MCFKSLVYFLVLFVQEPSQLAREASSYFECCVAHSACWESGDFLVRQFDDFDSTRIADDGRLFGVVKRTETLYRVVFDESKGQYLYIIAKINSKTNFPEAKEESDSQVVAWCHEGESGKSARLFPDGLWKTFEKNEKKKAKSAEELLRRERFPDFSGFWFFRKPTAYGELKRSKSLQALIQADNFHSSSTSGNSLKVEYESPGLNVPFFRTFYFDQDSLYMTSRKAVVRRNGRKFTTAGFKLESREINEVRVPTVGTEFNRKMSQDRSEFGDFGKHFKFHWFSINDPSKMDSEMFSVDQISSAKAAMRLVDPVLTKADSLLPSHGEND